MADTTLEAVIKLRDEMSAQLKQVNNALKQLGNQSDQVNDRLSNTESMMSNLKNNFAEISQAAMQAGQQMVNWGQNILGAIGNVVQTTREWTAEVAQSDFMYAKFDKSTQGVIDSLNDNAEALAMTEQQYTNVATAVTAFYRSAGQTTAQINKMLPSTMQLVNDMSAFADVPIDTAMDDFKSALVGNFNALDKYGVAVSVATINEGEYAKSIGKAWENMSMAEKQQAILNETTRQAADYLGLAEQEAGEFGKQSDYMAQTIKEAKSALGEAFLPILTPLVEKIAEIAQKIATWAQEHPKLAQALMIAAAAIGVLLVVGGSLLMLLGLVGAAMTAVTTITGLLGVSIGAICAPVLAVIAVFAALVAAGIWVYNNWETIKQKAQELCDKYAILGAAANLLGSIWNLVWTAIKTLVAVVVEAVKVKIEFLKSTWEKAWNAIQSVWNVVGPIISAGLDGLASIINKVADAVDWLADKWQSAMNFIKNNPITGSVSTTGSFGGGSSGGHMAMATGYNRIPYDGFQAVLHQGERVLAARDARQMDRNDGVGSSNINISISEMNVRQEADIEAIASQLARKISQQKIIYGG